MKKIFTGTVVFSLLLVLSACSIPKQVTEDIMLIKPSEFSEETKKVLSLLDEEIMFFDFALDETINSFTINVWVFENGRWIDKGDIAGNTDKTNHQVAIQITENGYNIFTIDESGHIKYSAPETKINFENSKQQLTNKVTNPTNIIAGKEIPLFVKTGNNESQISIPTDFRDANCIEGVAVTITFLNQEIE